MSVYGSRIHIHKHNRSDYIEKKYTDKVDPIVEKHN